MGVVEPEFTRSDDERESGKAQVRAALEQLPVSASYNQMQTASEKALAPIEAKIRERKETKRKEEQKQRDPESKQFGAKLKANSYVQHIERHLNEEYEFDEGYSALIEERDRIRDRLEEELLEDPDMTHADIRSLIEDLAEE